MFALRKLLIGVVMVGGTTNTVFAQAGDLAPDFESCRVIAEDRARLDCLKNLLSKSQSGAPPAEPARPDGLWPLIRTPRPGGGPDAVAVMRTADITQSDPDLAGLLIRCRDKPGLEVVLALVRPFPPRSKRDVMVALGDSQITLQAETAAAGTALVLPVDAITFTTGPWQNLKQLSVTIKDPEADIRGVIPLDGIKPAISALLASCPTG